MSESGEESLRQGLSERPVATTDPKRTPPSFSSNAPNYDVGMRCPTNTLRQSLVLTDIDSPPGEAYLGDMVKQAVAKVAADPREDLVISILSVNQYSLERTYRSSRKNPLS